MPFLFLQLIIEPDFPAYRRSGQTCAKTILRAECAKKAGLLQLELDVVSDNTNAISMYEKAGFTEYGRNPIGFRRKDGSFQELVLMRLELYRA